MDPDYWAFRVFAEALGGGMSSRLFQAVREARGLAYAIDAYAESWSDAGVLGIYAGCAPGDAGALAEAAAAEIVSLVRDIGPAELARAKAQLKGSLFMGRESLANRAEQAAAQMLVFGRTVGPAEFVRWIDAVDAPDVARVGGGVAAAGRAAVAILGPRGAADASKRFMATLAA
jgi:predicted Zn-dependent peptidase